MAENEKNFLNLHALVSHSPSCLNRDDMNMQKAAIFGGVRRVRISSQCLKRAMRGSDYWTTALGRASIRTRELAELKMEIQKDIRDKTLQPFVDEAVDRIAGAGKFAKGKKGSGKAGPMDQEDAGPEEAAAAAEAQEPGKGKEAKGIAVAPWTTAQVEGICRLLADARKRGLKSKQLEKEIEEGAENLREDLKGGGMDVALFGRMATSGIMQSMDGAMAVAHTITTHAAEADLDWFTAVDDLVQSGAVKEREDAGAGHMNTQEFGAGVFYRYASLNIGQLRKHLGDAPRQKAMEIGVHLAHMLATVVPTGKQQGFAAHNPADFVMASLTDIPVSAANAFEKPVASGNGSGFMIPSIAAFEEYFERVYKGYGLGDQQAVFSLHEIRLKPRAATLKYLEDWIRGQ